MHGTDLPQDTWVEEVLNRWGYPPHVEQHLTTMALLHRAGRYDRATDDAEKLTEQRASTLGDCIIDTPAFSAEQVREARGVRAKIRER